MHMEMFKEALKSFIKGTPLEPLAKSCATQVQYYSLPKEVRMNRMYDGQTSQIMSRILSPTSTCVDVGCNRGSILREIIRFAPDVAHLAFEPIPELAEQLRKTFASSKARIYELALSDSIGEATFQHVLNSPGHSGLRKRSYPMPDAKIQEITVRTERLDNIIPLETRIDFIKIDVEGAEFQVLSGAIETVKRYKPFIVFEHGIGGADYYGTTPEMMFKSCLSGCLPRLLPVVF